MMKPRSNLVVHIEDSDMDDITEIVEIHVDWGGQPRTQLLNYPREILLKIVSRLYICSPHIGVKISHNSVFDGYTEI